ncbi:DUF6941 family protein [Promicromonospora sp. CA-289599]|uniref:DUF6941 family protein n=1 Tax=Promicromonospora sp. CA-289599 TaxID=3240014 RepID=UPI003D93D4E4
MIELDYAFLADYARVEGGKLTAVGASYTHTKTPGLPAAHLVCVAGRIRVSEDVHTVDLGARFSAPRDMVVMDISGTLDADGGIPYEGRKGVLFAFQMQVGLPVPGLYTVDLSLDGKHVRTLKFDVSVL